MVTLPVVTLTGAQQSVTVADFLPGPATIRIANESSYALQVQMGSGTHWLNPFMADLFHPSGGITSFTVTPSLLTSAQPLSLGTLLVTLAEPGEKIPGTYPVDLSRQNASLTPQVLLGLAVTNTQKQVVTQTYSLPGGTHSVALMAQNSALLSGLTVTGATSGKQYLNITTTTDASFPAFSPVVSAVDTAVTMTITEGATGGIVYGGAEPDFGSSPPQLANLAAHEAEQQRKLSIVHWFIAWKAGNRVQDPLNQNPDLTQFFRTDVADAVAARHSVPMVTMEPWDVNAPSTNPYTLTDIASGVWDALLLQNWINPIKAWGKRLLLRPFGEMNGNWSPWGYQSTQSGGTNTAAQIVSAWQHVWNLFNANGVTNVEWVWCPNSSPTSPNLSSFYPGDGYVDWLGCDVYNFNTPWTTFTAVFTTAYAQITAVNATKPIIIAEFGCVEGSAGQKATWLTNVGGEMSGTFPRITAACYFDIEDPNHTGLRLNSTPGALAAAQAAFPASPYNISPYFVSVWLTAVLDPLAVISNAGTQPPPWQAPRSYKTFIKQLAAGASYVIVSGVPGQRIYVHTFSGWHTSNPAGASYQILETGGGTELTELTTQSLGPYNIDWKGVPIPLGAGLTLKNFGAVDGGFVIGSLTYSQA